jgi:hypothetical protein
MHPNQAQAESYYAGLAEHPAKIKPTRPEQRYFETMAWFDSPDDAEEAKAALAAAGYAFEQTPYVFDVSNGFLLTLTVYGVIAGYTDEPDAGEVFHQLREIICPFGDCDSYGFRDAPSSQDERYRTWTSGRNLADVRRVMEG